MKLTLKERILVVNSLSAQGSYEDLIIRKDAIEKIGLLQDELEKFEVKTTENGGLAWNEEGASKKFDIKLSTLESEYIKRQLKKLSDQEKLTADLLEVYKMFNK
jgi:hypothetical protein